MISVALIVVLSLTLTAAAATSNDEKAGASGNSDEYDKKFKIRKRSCDRTQFW
jgi:hypothetical protein